MGLYVSKLTYHHEGEEKVLIHKYCVSFTFIYGVYQAELRIKRPQCSSAMHPKASHSVGPLSNKSRYDTISVSLVSVGSWWKNHPNMPTGSTNICLLKAVELQCQNFFRFWDAAFQGKGIGFGFMKKVRPNSPRIRIGLSYGMPGFPPILPRKKHNKCAWFFPKKAWLALVSSVTWSEQVNQKSGVSKTHHFCDEERHQNQTNSKLQAYMFLYKRIQCMKPEICRNCSVVFWLYLPRNILNVKNICQLSATIYCIPGAFLMYSTSTLTWWGFLKEHYFFTDSFKRNFFVNFLYEKCFCEKDAGLKMVHCWNLDA